MLIFAEDRLHSAICEHAHIALVCTIFANKKRVFRTNNNKHHKAYDEKSTIYDVFNDIAAWRTC